MLDWLPASLIIRFAIFLVFGVVVIYAYLRIKGIALAYVHFARIQADELAKDDPYFRAAYTSYQDEKAWKLYIRAKKRRQTQEKPLDTVQRFLDAYPGISPGEFYSITENAPMGLPAPGTIVFCQYIRVDNRSVTGRTADAFDTVFTNMDGKLVMQSGQTALPLDPIAEVFVCDDRGYAKSDDKTPVYPKYLERLSDTQKSQLAYEDDSVFEPVPLDEYFEAGDPIFVEPTLIMKRYEHLTLTWDLKEKLPGWVDIPEITVGTGIQGIVGTTNDPMLEVRSAWYIYQPDALGREKIRVNTVPLRRQFIGPEYPVYFPRYREFRPLDHEYLSRREYDDQLLLRVMPDKDERLALLRVAPPKNPKVLDDWGFNAGLNAQKNNIVIFFGDHGVGKTLTIHALAEYLHMPIYIASHADLVNSGPESNLKNLAEIARRTGAMVFIDEGEVFIKDRSQFSHEEAGLTAMMLQQLDTYDAGILAIATNHASRIDSGLNSRFAVKVMLTLDTEKRERIWREHIPAGIKESIGDSAICDLAKIAIDGRQIRDALQFSAIQASNEGKDTVPVEYMRRQAELIHRDATHLQGMSNEEFNKEIEEGNTYL